MSSTDCENLVKTTLEAGTWANYTAGPPIIDILYERQASYNNNEYITLDSSTRSPILALNGAIIVTPKDCTLKIFAANNDNKNNMYLDVLAILKAARSFNVTNVRDLHPYRGGFELEMKINVID